MKLSSLLDSIQKNIVKKTNFKDQEILGLCLDYRKAEEKNLFFALGDEEFENAQIPIALENYKKAIKNGAVCVISNSTVKLEIPKHVVWIQVKDIHVAMAHVSKKFFKNPFEKTKIIGITGTNGKTTTSQFIDSMLEQFKKNTVVMGTLGIMTKEKNVQTGLTTPLALDIFRTFKNDKKHNLEYLVIELSSHGGYYKRTDGLDFDIIVFTNLTQDHLDFHPTLEHYKNTKLGFVVNLKKQKKKAQTIINIDDMHSKDFIQESKNAKVKYHTYSVKDPNADFYAKILKLEDGKSVFEVFNKGKFMSAVCVSIPGIFNVYNVLASFCVCYLLGFSVKKITTALANLSTVEGRFEAVSNNKGISVFVDYAHTPDSLKNILQSMKKTFISKNSNRKLICVFGCGGNRDKRKRPLMGKIAADFCDVVVLTSDNPRNESEMTIIKEIQQGIPKKFKNLHTEKNRKKAIFFALKIAKKDDLVLVSGKGHEKFQIIKNKKTPFSDRETILKFFSQIPK